MTTLGPLDERLHRANWKTLIELSGAPTLKAYGFDDVPGMKGTDGQLNPGTVPPIFVLLSVQRRFVAVKYQSGSRGVNAVRFSTRVVGRTEDEAAWARMKVAAAVEERIVAFGPDECTPVMFENEDPIAFDDGRYSGLTRWTYQV